jgi:hypothetical protein
MHLLRKEGIPSGVEGNPSQVEGNPSRMEGKPNPAERNPSLISLHGSSPFNGLSPNPTGGNLYNFARRSTPDCTSQPRRIDPPDAPSSETGGRAAVFFSGRISKEICSPDP